MNKEESKKQTKLGWSKLIDKVYDLCDLLPFANVELVTTQYSMLYVKFKSTLDTNKDYILNCLTDRIRRDSSYMCEVCGEHAIRRKNLPDDPSLCHLHYTIQYNDYMETIASSTMTNNEPQNT